MGHGARAGRLGRRRTRVHLLLPAARRDFHRGPQRLGRLCHLHGHRNRGGRAGAARAERRQLEAEEGRREIEQLYQQLGAAFERASEAEAARRNEQLKAALLDALTHNLRTPLTAIKAAVTALIGIERGNVRRRHRPSEGRRDLLQVIDEESDRLNRFIEGLSAADRPDVSQPPHLRAVTDLEPIVREALHAPAP